MRFRKRPIVIEAWQWQGQPIDNWPPWVTWGASVDEANTRRLTINSLEGRLSADLGDWIIQGIRGELYPCKPDIFTETYEPVAQDS
jgi:hypothetical protein